MAREMIRWMDEWLSDRERGGFYASQDADFSLDDDGDYFTWTRDEAAAVLTPEEMAVASAYYDIGEIGDMHHNPAKNVLHVRGTLEGVAKANEIDAGGGEGAAGVGEDEAVCGAAEAAYSVCGQDDLCGVERDVHLGLSRGGTGAGYAGGAGVCAEVAGPGAGGGVGCRRPGWRMWWRMARRVATAAQVAGVLDDYVFLGHAALDAWEMTGEMRYYDAAEAIMESAMARFYDSTGCGFFDTEAAAKGEVRLGALVTRRKPLQDSPTPAGNPMGAALLLRLEALNGREDYAVKALETLETFAGVVEHFGLYAASYGLALQRMVQRAVQVCVIGDDAAARRLEAVALARYAVNKSVIRLRRDQLDALPPSAGGDAAASAGVEGRGKFRGGVQWQGLSAAGVYGG